MKRQIHTEVDATMADAIQRIADEHRWSFSQAAREMLREAIERRNGGKDDGHAELSRNG